MTAEPWETKSPDLIAEVWLYPADKGGRSIPVLRGYGCPILTDKERNQGWDVRMQLGDEPFEPGTKRMVGLVFLSREGLSEVQKAGRFYLYESRFIGEAKVVG